MMLLISFSVLLGISAASRYRHPHKIRSLSRVVDWNSAKIGSAPYQVSLRDTHNHHYCGGSILNERWILTSAHCLDDDQLDKIYVGSNYLSKYGEYYYVERFVVHENYDRNSFDFDIGLAEVEEMIVFKYNVEPAALHAHYVDAGAVLRLTGWERMDKITPLSKEGPDRLKELYLIALTDQECYRRMGEDNPTHMCAVKKSLHGVCAGDTGGPLMMDGQQVGILSFKLGDCADKLPHYFTRISKFRHWIDGHVHGLHVL